MEELKTLVVENWPMLAEYAAMFIAYFLVFLFRNKVAGTEQNLNLAFKEFRAKFVENEVNSKAELAASKAQYAAAVEKIEKLEARVKTLNDTIFILLDDSEYSEVEDDTEYT